MDNLILSKRDEFRENKNMIRDFLNKKEFFAIFLLSLLVNSFSYPDDMQNIWEKAYEKVEKGEYEESWKEYEKLLVKNPKNYDVVLGAGCIKYYQAEKSIDAQQLDKVKNLIQEAEHYFDSAVQLAETSEKKADSLYNKGNCNLLLANAQKENPQMIQESINHYRNAIRFYRESIENKSDFPEAKKNLNHALYQLKQLLQKKEENEKQNKQDSQSDKDQKFSTMFLETKTDIPDADIHVLEEQPNVVELKKKSN